ncbi:Transferase protein [Dioscorea alata]|uniref:Transferase protein n=1 Tax=Dioscorea alata TaxID=55571 RepID=A0ACB7UEA5_DIOAL|nr:Transferase protein [Dioscorea alata]
MATLNFSVIVGEAELISPELPTPAEFKYLSNLDIQTGLLGHVPFIHYYNSQQTSEQHDPVTVLRRALSKALVYYYPLAGRLRPGHEKGKLLMDCCAEGVVFRAADADVTLDQLMTVSGGLRPPSPYLSKFLVDDVWGGNFITNSPLLRMQVTKLRCGGFVLGYTMNHCVCDAYGIYQFITTMSELAREPNRSVPTQQPVWSRELLRPRNPLQPLFPHPEYNMDPNPNDPAPESDFRNLTQFSIFFTRSEISALKSQINGPKTPTFDAITALLWRVRTRVLGVRSETRLFFAVDTRGRHRPLLPAGYYGVAIIIPCTIVPAKQLGSRPLSFAAGLISELKRYGSDKDYRSSVVDFIEAHGPRGFSGGQGAFAVSDVSKLKFADVDFGWGPGVYGGLARAGTTNIPGMVAFLVGYKREDGVDGLLALLSLPRGAVDAFKDEVRNVINGCKMRSSL